ncbi:glycosyltransferase family 4 protein [Myxococcaceae bacterium GXIMD 01537]
MKLVFVGTSLGARGTETHLVCLARALTRAGHEVLTVAHPEGFIARELRASGLPVEPGVFRNAMDPRGLAAVRRASRRLGADWLVSSFGHEYWPVLLLGRLMGTRVALFRHLNAPLKYLTRSVLPRLAHRYIAVSESMRTLLAMQGVDPGRVQLLYNPLDVAHFRPAPELRAATRAALGLAEEDVLVGFVGSIDPGKGAFTLARAFNRAMPRAPRLRALWVGQESAHAALREALTPELRERHHLRGWTADPRPLYAALDGLAIPSQAEEPFGRVSIEAQACGVPVLGSRVGGIPETLKDGVTGHLLPPGDWTTWGDALAAYTYVSVARRAEMGRAGIRFVSERFEAGRIAGRFAELLQEAPR